jgi:hypothetical protein
MAGCRPETPEQGADIQTGALCHVLNRIRQMIVVGNPLLTPGNDNI